MHMIVRPQSMLNILIMQHQAIFFPLVSLSRFQPSCRPLFPQLSRWLALYGPRVGTVAPLLTYLTMNFSLFLLQC